MSQRKCKDCKCFCEETVYLSEFEKWDGVCYRMPKRELKNRRDFCGMYEAGKFNRNG